MSATVALRRCAPWGLAAEAAGVTATGRTAAAIHRRRLAASSPAPPGAAAGGFVDVHCHLADCKAWPTEECQDAAVQRAREAGLSRVVVNGVEPESNRRVLDLCARHSDVLRPALGIYPLNACAAELEEADFIARFPRMRPPPAFDVAEELAFIDGLAAEGKLAAIGECGLDGMYGYSSVLMDAQVEVLRELCRLAKRHRLPVIVHARAAEKRTLDVLVSEGVELADFHCFMGKKVVGLDVAAAGYFLSVPSLVVRNGQFRDLCQALPAGSLLTETDAPYLPPRKGQWPNEPCTVPAGIEAMAEARREDPTELRLQVARNYDRLFVSKAASELL